MKGSFILYTKYAKQIQMLNMEQRGTLFTAILNHEREEELPEMDAMTEMAFMFIKVDLDENTEKYDDKCKKNQVNGQKGGRPKKTEKTEKSERFLENRTQPKKADNDNEYDNEYENENDNDLKKKETKKEKKHTFGEYKHVLLTASEYDRLVKDYGSAKTEQAVTYLDEYIEEKGYKSKSHNLAIRRWVFNALEERSKPRGQPSKYGSPGKFGSFPARNDQEHRDLVAKVIAMQ